jgi:predicted ATPase
VLGTARHPRGAPTEGAARSCSNREHLLDAVVELVRELRRAVWGGCSTSREGLGIAENASWSCILTLPKYADERRCRTARARLLIAGGFRCNRTSIDRCNAAAIAEGGARLDGIPLVLELAAARIPMLGLAARNVWISGSVLAGGRGAPSNATPRFAAINWSYDMLSADEQQVLARLGVRGAAPAAEAVLRPGHRRPRGLRPAHIVLVAAVPS